MVLTRKFIIIDPEIIKLMEAYYKEGCGVISPQILLHIIEGKVTQKFCGDAIQVPWTVLADKPKTTAGDDQAPLSPGAG